MCCIDGAFSARIVLHFAGFLNFGIPRPIQKFVVGRRAIKRMGHGDKLTLFPAYLFQHCDSHIRFFGGISITGVPDRSNFHGVFYGLSPPLRGRSLLSYTLTTRLRLMPPLAFLPSVSAALRALLYYPFLLPSFLYPVFLWQARIKSWRIYLPRGLSTWRGWDPRPFSPSFSITTFHLSASRFSLMQ